MVSGDLAVQSTQQVSGNRCRRVDGDQHRRRTPATTVSLTAATGNAGSSVIDGGGTLSGGFLQTSAGPTVDAESQINAANAQTADASFRVQVVANGQQLGATDSAIAAAVTQTNAATVTANGGAVLGDVTDQGSFVASGAGNSLTSVGQGSSRALDVTQTNTGQVTQGAMFVNLGNSEITDTAASATGNNANISNTEGPLAVTDSQNNQSFVNAQAVETSFEYGGATVSAEGVGNAAFAGNVGPSLAVNNTQVNGAEGVEASASFTSEGSPGFDAFASSTATGNAVTGFACSACGGVMNVTSSQTNLGDAAASSQIGLAGPARSVRGVATATGNSASFYVTQPN